MELLNYLKERKLKKKIGNNYKLLESKIAESLDNILSEQLSDDIKLHVFEINKKYIDSAIAVIDKPPLSNKYIIVQIDETLFEARLKDITI